MVFIHQNPCSQSSSGIGGGNIYDDLYDVYIEDCHKLVIKEYFDKTNPAAFQENGLMVPVIIPLLFFLLKSLIDIIGFFGEYSQQLYVQRKTTDIMVKNPGKDQMEIITKEGNKINKYTPSDNDNHSAGNKGRRVGSAYQLENGEIIYIPE